MEDNKKFYSLADLKNVVDWTIEEGIKYHGKAEDIPVLITLSEPSIGGREFSKVYYVGMGFDWEHGQFRIEPDKQLVNRGNAVTDVVPCVPRQYEGRTSYWCGRCQDKVSKSDCYCRTCGQKMR